MAESLLSVVREVREVSGGRKSRNGKVIVFLCRGDGAAAVAAAEDSRARSREACSEHPAAAAAVGGERLLLAVAVPETERVGDVVLDRGDGVLLVVGGSERHWRQGAEGKVWRGQRWRSMRHEMVVGFVVVVQGCRPDRELMWVLWMLCNCTVAR